MLNDAFAKALAAPATTVEVVHAVEILDYPHVRDTFDHQHSTIEMQRAEIAQLRMLLKEALAQIERYHSTTRSGSTDFNRLTKRANNVLEASTLRKDTP